MKYIGLILLLSLSLQTATAYTDSLQAVQYRDLALEKLKEDKIDSSLYYKNQALDLFKKNEDLINWINTFKVVGRIYRDKKKEPEAALKEFQQATLDQLWRQPATDEEWAAMGWLNVNFAYLYASSLGKYEVAGTYYENARAIFSDRLQQEDRNVIEYIYRELANIYTRLGDYPAAEILLIKCKDISIKNNYSNLAAEVCSDLGLIYSKTEAPEKAIEIYKEGLGLHNLSESSLGLLNINLMKIYKKIEKEDQALKHLNKAQLHFQQSVQYEKRYKSKIWLSSTLVEKAKFAQNRKNFRQSEAYFQEAYTIFKDTYFNEQRREFGQLFASMAEMYLDWGKFEKALEYQQKALTTVLVDFKPTNVLENPNPNSFYAETTIMDVLDGKAKVLMKYFEEEDEVKYLKTALECYELIYEVEQQLRRSYHYESSKLYSIEESRIRSEEAIRLALQLYELTKAESYKEQAFEFAERSKSILLLEAFQKADATAIAGIPEDLIQQEKSIQEEIALTEKDLFNAKEKEESSETIKALENKLLSLRQNYTDWIFDLEQQYPQYYNLKYNFNTASIAEVQTLLQKNQRSLVEYFVGDSTIYTFLISANRFEVLQQAKDFPLSDWVINLKTDIEQFQFNGTDRAQLCSSYTEKAQNLYQKLIAPLKEYQLSQKLTIIPSGVLGYLPFDALLTQAPQQNCTFQDYPYLVYQHSISFGYSATLQVALSQNDNRHKHQFLGFGPKFDGNGGFNALNYNVKSLQAIQDKVGGKLLLDNMATMDVFKELASKYDIIQLATHAEANTSTGDFSFIVFADGQGDYDSLFVKDLYLIDLMAEMVVLSACETAVGKLHKGEGIISLARGFLQSGAQSVLTTLWSINDETNKLLMLEFYKQLKKGAGKDDALQRAKLNQLKQADRLYGHPVYWAAFAPMGDMKPIYNPTNTTLLYIGGILLAIGLFFLFQLRNKQSRPSVIMRKLRKQRPWSKVGL